MEEVLRRYPDRIPVNIDKESDFDINRRKYLIPKDMTIAQFSIYIRNRLKLKPSEALFTLIGGVLPPNSCDFGTLYNTRNSTDNMIHVVLKRENTFG